MINPNGKEMHQFLHVQEHDKEKPKEAIMPQKQPQKHNCDT